VTTTDPLRIRRRPRSAATLAVAVAALLAAGCAKSQPNLPVAEPPATAVNDHLGEARTLLTSVAEKDANLDYAGMTGQTAGPVKLMASFGEAINGIDAYLKSAEPKKKTAKVDATGVTELRKDGGHIVAGGELKITTDDETMTWSEIELIDEGGLKVYDFRESKSGLKASQQVVAGDSSLANDDVEAKLEYAACSPPDGSDAAVSVLMLSYKAKGSGRVKMSKASLKPKGSDTASLKQGLGDPTRPSGTARAVLAFEGEGLFTEGTVTAIFTDTESSVELPPLTLKSPAFPDPKACGTAATKRSTTGTTASSSSSSSSSGGSAATSATDLLAAMKTKASASADDWNLWQTAMDTLHIPKASLTAAAIAAPKGGASLYAETVYSKELDKQMTAFAINDGTTCAGGLLTADDDKGPTTFRLITTGLTTAKCSASAVIEVAGA
jgi:hypothetical protein